MASNRREFIKCCSALTLAGAASFSKLGLMQALAQSTSDYKALVCIFLFGGNDGSNVIVPMDAAAYNQYSTARQNLALQQAALQNTTFAAASQQANFAFNPDLLNVYNLYAQKKLAVVAKVSNAIAERNRIAKEWLQTLTQGEVPAEDAEIARSAIAVLDQWWARQVVRNQGLK